MSQNALQKKLFCVKQFETESVKQFADRVMKMGSGGFPTFNEEELEKLVMLPFLHGCRNSATALAVLDRAPQTIARAVSMMQ